MSFNRKFVNVIGCGFAGIECALFLASHGIKVHVFEGGKVEERDVYDEKSSAVKKLTEELLVRELERLGSPLIKEGRLNGFNERGIISLGKRLLEEHPNVKIISASIHEINPHEVTVIATGSYTDEGMSEFLVRNFGGMLCHSFLPIYPVFDCDGNGLYKRGDNLLLGLSYEDYLKFINGVVDEIRQKGLEKEALPPRSLERLVYEGKNALRDFSLRPVLVGNEKPYASIKFSKTENGLVGVGLASTLPRASQERIFSNIDYLKDCRLISKGRMLKICQISSPYMVSEFHQSLMNKNIFFAGAILGISGYVDCIASGLYTALNVLKYVQERAMVKLSNKTAVGKMAEVISSQDRKNGGFLEDYQIFSKEDLKNKDIVNIFARRSMVELAIFKEEYNGKYV